jgi:hypothetical protein
MTELPRERRVKWQSSLDLDPLSTPTAFFEEIAIEAIIFTISPYRLPD